MSSLTPAITRCSAPLMGADSGSRARPSARPRAGAVERVLAVRLARFILASPVEPQRTAGTPRPRTRASAPDWSKASVEVDAPAAHAAPGALLEAVAAHVDVNAKTRWEHELRAGRHGGERERDREQTAAGNDRPRHHVTPKLSPRRNAVKGSRCRLSSYSAWDDTASRRTRSVNRSS